jgi:hypothetical protein
MMQVRRWWYLVVLGVGVLALMPFLLGSAAASAGKPPLPPKPSPKLGQAPASAPKATANTPFVCGELATTSITLTANENCPGNNGIFAGANGITINLNGHTLTGDGTHIGVSANGFSSVTVTNGVIVDFTYGVVLTGNTDHATSLQVTGNAVYGILAELGTGDTITGNYLLGNNIGIDAVAGSGGQVGSNWVEGSTDYGILALDNSGSLMIATNKVLNTSGNGYGIVVEADAGGSVTGNVANGNAADGIFLDNPGSGVKPAVTATGNRAAFNAGLGIDSAPGGAVDGGSNVVQDNTSAAQCVNIVCHEVST